MTIEDHVLRLRGLQEALKQVADNQEDDVSAALYGIAWAMDAPLDEMVEESIEPIKLHKSKGKRK